MIKLDFKIFLCAFSLFTLLGAGSLRAQQDRSAKQFDQIKTAFINAPDSIQTSIYWYWLSDNISKQGVINDLEAMKKVGINRAFIGNIGLEDMPYGKLKMFSEEWWDIMHTALKTATRLNIEIGLFNSPGWSQSGGPWVKPEQAMRYLTSAQVKVTGPTNFDQRLPLPNAVFQDVKVIAYPAGENTDISLLKPKFSSSPANKDLRFIMDNDLSTAIKLERDQPFTLNIDADQNFTARSLTINLGQAATSFRVKVLIEKDGKYLEIKDIKVNRSNSNLNVGFAPYGPAAISFPANTAKKFKIIFSEVTSPYAITELRLSQTPIIEDFIEKSLAKMWQTPLPYWDAYLWKDQPETSDKKLVIDPAQVRDVSRFMAADGTLKWKVPAGDWIIERTGMTPTKVTNSPAAPEGKGLETDKMSKKHIAAHFDAFMGEVIRRVPAKDRKTWKMVVQDSYETGGQNWTDDFIKQFQKRYKYNPLPFLPVLQGKVVKSEDYSNRFLWDLRRLVSDKVAYDYVGGLGKISHKNGLRTWLECYGHWGFPGEFLQYGGQADEVGGEFWSLGDLGNIENRAASSSAHIYGKTKVSAESFTSGDPAFSRSPAGMKQRADRFFTEGINNSLLHVYIHQPDDDKLPGMNAWFGNEFNRNNTWFYDMDIFLQYLKRCNMMLQQGKYIADIAYFIGEDAPKMTGIQDPKLPEGYNFDYINAEVIETRVKVKDGKMVLPDGMKYSILVLPKLETMRPELLEKIKVLIEEGAVVLGSRPSKSPSMQNGAKADEKVKQLAAEIWGSIDGKTVQVNRLGKGMVIDGMDLQQAMDYLKIPADYSSTEKNIPFIHREIEGGAIYFLSNQNNAPISFNATFRIAGKKAQIWNPVTGQTRKLPIVKNMGASTEIPLELATLESAFIIFADEEQSSQSPRAVNFPNPSNSLSIDGKWLVQFDPQMRGPKNPVLFPNLEDWSKSQNDSIKYYAGHATYTNSFNFRQVKPGETIMLDLGNLSAIAKVKVNGIAVGGVWIAPYRLDITNALKTGKNKLEISVVNTWVNRLIGDSKLPMDQRKTSLTVNPYKPDSQLQSSGLLGPVKLETITY